MGELQEAVQPGTGPGWITYEAPEHETLTPKLLYEVQQCADDCRGFARMARVAQLQDLPAKFGLTWEAFCEQRLHQSHDFVEAILIGVETLGESVPIPAVVALKMGRQVLKQRARIQQAAQATTGETLPAKRPDKSAICTLNSLNHRANQNGVSRRTQIKLDRLSRDFPDLHRAVCSGELSVHAAAKQAGFVREPTPLELLHRVWDKLSQEEYRRFLQDTLTPADWEWLRRPVEASRAG
jgi:hypothetical protein